MVFKMLKNVKIIERKCLIENFNREREKKKREREKKIKKYK